MAELKQTYPEWTPVQIELSPIDLFIVTQAVALHLFASSKVVPLAGALKRIGNMYYNALKTSGFEIPTEIEELWAEVGICQDPESDPGVLII